MYLYVCMYSIVFYIEVTQIYYIQAASMAHF
jgi:hypothetical protein